MIINTEIADCYQEMFNHFAKEHGIILTVSEMDEIIILSINVYPELSKQFNKMPDINFKKLQEINNKPKNDTIYNDNPF